eukprot:SAG31_NODE_177_length_21310_cov_8.894064_7_plen_72_part_00
MDLWRRTLALLLLLLGARGADGQAPSTIQAALAPAANRLIDSLTTGTLAGDLYSRCAPSLLNPASGGQRTS